MVASPSTFSLLLCALLLLHQEVLVLVLEAVVPGDLQLLVLLVQLLVLGLEAIVPGDLQLLGSDGGAVFPF